MTAIYNSVTLMYDGICATCGQPTGSADLWQDTCPRCAELAALEREIGRAMLYEDLANNAAGRVMADGGACWILYEAANNAMLATIPLIARWRRLRAAGAEEGR